MGLTICKFGCDDRKSDEERSEKPGSVVTSRNHTGLIFKINQVEVFLNIYSYKK